MLNRIEGKGMTDLTLALEGINLSQRGSSNPKVVRVSYEYDSVDGSFSIRCEEMTREKDTDGAV